MSTIRFFEKRGCATNAKQKKCLQNAGHTLLVEDLLAYPWAENAVYLRTFFGEKPLADWFNGNAPDIKNAVIDVALFDEKSAIDAMMANPLLIRRPLMEWDSVKMAGFDANEVRAKLGLDLENLPQDSCSMQRAEAH
ncbi:MAG: nitrogenase-associated protein [Methylococcales bacterium]|jgi:nitrogenase-associated protein|nr:nitrogenase-associated protein [Methylococcales bacterium]